MRECHSLLQVPTILRCKVGDSSTQPRLPCLIDFCETVLSQFGLKLQFALELVSPVGGRETKIGIEQLPSMISVVSRDTGVLVASCVHLQQRAC